MRACCLGEGVISVSSLIILLQLQRFLSSLAHPLMNFCVESKPSNAEAASGLQAEPAGVAVGSSPTSPCGEQGWDMPVTCPPREQASVHLLNSKDTWLICNRFSSFNWLDFSPYPPSPTWAGGWGGDGTLFLLALVLKLPSSCSLAPRLSLAQLPCGWALRSHFPAEAKNHASKETWRWVKLTKFAAYLKSQGWSGHLSLSCRLLLNHQRLICVPLMWAVSVFPVNDGRLNVINGPKRHSWGCTNPQLGITLYFHLNISFLKF